MNDDNHNQGLFSNWPPSLPPGSQEQPQQEPVRSAVPPAERKTPESTAETSEGSERHGPAAAPVGAAERAVPHLGGEKKLPGKRNRAGYGQYTAYLRTSTRKNVQIALLTRTGEERDFSELVEDLLTAWLESPAI